MAQSEKTKIGNDLSLSNVLIARFSAIGDVAMTIPVVYSACSCYSSVRFVMVTRRSLAPIFVNKPANLEVVGADLSGEHHGWSGITHLMANLKAKYSLDAFIDLQNDSRTLPMRLFCFTHGIRMVRFNKAQHHKKALSRRTNKIMLPLTSTRARYREAFFKAGLPIEETFESIYGKDTVAPPQCFANIVSTPKEPGEKWIGIAPFALYPEKEYPAEQMQEVIEMLIAHGPYRIFIFGGEGREKEIAQSWERAFPGVTSLAGHHYGFPSELALLSSLDVMLTMDSANMHLASIVGTPTVSVWGATHHYCGFKGWRQSETDMVQLPLSCRPCSVNGDKPCYRHDRLCLTAIRPETIFNKLLEKIN